MAWPVSSFHHLEDIRPVLGEQRLVPGDDRFPRAESGADEIVGLAGSPDEFDDDVDIRVGDEVLPGRD